MPGNPVGHPPCEDVSWNYIKMESGSYVIRHPPCEDVSWNTTFIKELGILPGHPPCEDVSWNKIFNGSTWDEYRHPPCEDVSWNIMPQFSLTVFVWSSSLWGCELKYSHSSSTPMYKRSSSLWGCELKYLLSHLLVLVSQSSSLWGCELKYGHDTDATIAAETVILLVRMWVEINDADEEDKKKKTSHPPCEDVSWNKLPRKMV